MNCCACYGNQVNTFLFLCHVVVADHRGQCQAARIYVQSFCPFTPIVCALWVRSKMLNDGYVLPTCCTPNKFRCGFPFEWQNTQQAVYRKRMLNPKHYKIRRIFLMS
mmetsp:Transcript_30245/g.51138  ORF Transcript_30245/g.51138 Transcript_30245/m.51138 type:complete len:107 (+) Transcript_30245:185-505(+)